MFIEHSAPTLGAYYCRVRGRDAFTTEELAAIERRMRDIVAADEPIRKTTVTRAEAIAIFEQRGETDKARLLAHRDRETVTLYELRARIDYFQGFMLPSTGRLRRFALHPLAPGFLLQYPHQASPTELTPFEPYPRLFAAFSEAGEWLDRLGIRSTGALNDAIAEERLPEVSLVAEALHEARIARIAADIVRRDVGPRRPDRGAVIVRQDDVREAPGGAAAGQRPPAIRGGARRLLPRSRVARRVTRHGELDFESLAALDVPLINEHLLGADVAARRWRCRATRSAPARAAAGRPSRSDRTTSSSSKASTG